MATGNEDGESDRFTTHNGRIEKEIDKKKN